MVYKLRQIWGGVLGFDSNEVPPFLPDLLHVGLSAVASDLSLVTLNAASYACMDIQMGSPKKSEPPSS